MAKWPWSQRYGAGALVVAGTVLDGETASALGVGTDLVDLKALREGQQQIITERAREFVRIVRDARMSS